MAVSTASLHDACPSKSSLAASTPSCAIRQVAIIPHISFPPSFVALTSIFYMVYTSMSILKNEFLSTLIDL